MSWTLKPMLRHSLKLEKTVLSSRVLDDEAAELQADLCVNSDSTHATRAAAREQAISQVQCTDKVVNVPVEMREFVIHGSHCAENDGSVTDVHCRKTRRSAAGCDSGGVPASSKSAAL